MIQSERVIHMCYYAVNNTDCLSAFFKRGYCRCFFLFCTNLSKEAQVHCVCAHISERETASACEIHLWMCEHGLFVCVCVCKVLFASLGQRRCKVSKITKSVWQLTISGFWLRFVDMTSPWVSPKLTPGILGCLALPQTYSPSADRNRRQFSSSPALPPCWNPSN